MPEEETKKEEEIKNEEVRDTSLNDFTHINKIEEITEQIIRDPIIIIGDDAFTSDNGVSNGTGTEQDPFIITNFSKFFFSFFCSFSSSIK